MNGSQRTASGLWQDYLFLSREMLKFIDKKDYDLFFELMRQREVVQQALDELEYDDFKRTEQGRGSLAEIRVLNSSIMQKMQLFLNNARHKKSVSNAYDGSGETWAAGSRLDTIVK